MKSLGIFIFLGLSISAVSHAQEGSDIWLGDFTLEPTASISNLVPISDNEQYTNQPYFFDINHLYYTQALGADDAVQMDIFVHRIRENQSKNVSNSDESEYSATPLPYDEGMSVIRVDASGKQALWELSSAGEPMRHLVPAIEPVGYQVWLNANELLLFVLGEPHTLQRADINQLNSAGKVIDDNIGASLYQFANSDWFLYTRASMGNFSMLKAYHRKTGLTQDIMPMPEGIQYFSVSPNGYVITSDGQQLLMHKLAIEGNSLLPTDAWQAISIEGSACASGINRTAISPLGDKIALVCARQ
jgi:hypothetical protein